VGSLSGGGEFGAGLAALVATDDPGRVMNEETYQEYERITQATTLAQLRALPDGELVRRHDFILTATVAGWQIGPDDYLNELRRRETERQSRRLEWLTWALFLLTAALVALELLPRISGAGHRHTVSNADKTNHRNLRPVTGSARAGGLATMSYRHAAPCGVCCDDLRQSSIRRAAGPDRLRRDGGLGASG
jgi:hypothetical protein